MRFYPRSLFGRNALLLAALIVVGQLLGALVFNQFVLQPRNARYAESTADTVHAVEQALLAIDPPARPPFIAAYNAAQQAATGSSTPAVLRPLERLAIRAASRRLAQHGIEALWREEAGGMLYVRLRLDGADHWLAADGPYRRQRLPGAALLAWLIGAALAVTGAFLIQRRIDRPLRQLVAATQALGAGGRPPPLAEDGPSEIRSVARSFNRMAEALADAERERTLMLAGVSHDLRTPLAKLRLAVELSGDTEAPGLAADMARHCRQIDTIIDQFLDFARSDDGEAPRPTALDALLRDVLDSAGATREFACRCAPLPRLPLRPRAMQRALVNLVENARRHGAPDFSIEAGPAADGIRISVFDRGPGIAPDRADALIRPFVRGDGARNGPPGAGLGLAIADRIGRLHGGRLDLLPRAGGGLEARLTLPVPLG